MRLEEYPCNVYMESICIDNIVIHCEPDGWINLGTDGDEMDGRVDTVSEPHTIDAPCDEVDMPRQIPHHMRYNITLPSMDDSFDTHDRSITEHILCNGCTTLLYDEMGVRIPIY